MPGKSSGGKQISLNFNVYPRESIEADKLAQRLGMSKNALMRHAIELLYQKTKPLIDAEKKGAPDG